MNALFDVIIVAAGSGSRLGYETPKAYVKVGGKALLAYSVDAFITHAFLSRIILVVPDAMTAPTRNTFPDDAITIVSGGRERWESVRNGCSFVTTDWVLVHDAARPFVTKKTIDNLLEMRLKFDCVVTATPVVDTMRMFDGDIAGAIIDRTKLIRTGTPQLFRTALLKKAFASFFNETTPPTDEAMLMQNMGITVGIAKGDPRNFKITTREDLAIAEAMVAHGQSRY